MANLPGRVGLVRGFLSSNSTFGADFNLIAHIILSFALVAGVILVRQRRYRHHKYCQSAVILLNLPLIAFIMLPSFHNLVQPGLPGHLTERYFSIPTLHAAVGLIAQVLGLYVIAVAGTRLIPERLRFRNFKLWMRTTLGIWFVALFLGFAVYYVWYLAPSSSVSAHVRPGERLVRLQNFRYRPSSIRIHPGQTVVWTVLQGTHTVTAVGGQFDSGILTASHSFRHSFSRPGVFRFYCRFHGSPDGTGMTGKIIVVQ